ncbi:putative glucan 1,3-beta-glucosidase A [Hypsibius exemplaris]|uniref:glucan 1,3-beta-glucosidase n=1 Tax=Hypsibius exemplaris TaxID=2072580 RepID=A0A1W0WR27_HYPEX|nr:putative glucan 1,3-beta-glucosidase A [Hypsibius exemplaris]
MFSFAAPNEAASGWRTVLVICLLMMIHGGSAIQWNGNWAFACDFNGGDLSQATIPGDQCGGRCAGTPGCSHFTWTTWNGGTCFMKQGQGSKADAFATTDSSMVCGVIDTIQWNGNWAFGCDFVGNDLSSARISSDQCGGYCASTSGCTHFTWTSYAGGTCFMKLGSVSKADAFKTSDNTMVCGVVDGAVVTSTGGTRTTPSGNTGVKLTNVLSTRHGAFEAGACSLPSASYNLLTPVALGDISSLSQLKYTNSMCGHVLTIDCGHGAMDIIVTNSNLGGGLDLYASSWAIATANAPPGETWCSVQLSTRNPFNFDGPRCYYGPGTDLDNPYFRLVAVFNTGGRLVTGATLNGVAGSFNGVQPYFAFYGGPIGGEGRVVFSFNDVALLPLIHMDRVNILVYAFVVILIAINGASAATIQWNGNWAWDCDFPGGDLSQVKVSGDQCGGKCAATAGCTHYTWSAFNSGTCFMKNGANAKASAVLSPGSGTVCGVVNNIQWNGNWANGCDFTGADLSRAKVPGNQCGGQCAATPGCTHYTWSTFEGGTCFMKQGQVSKADAFMSADPSIVCGVTGVPLCDRDNDFEVVGYADLPGTDLNTYTNVDFNTCRQQCRSNAQCQYFFYGHDVAQCWTKRFNAYAAGTLGLLTSTGAFSVFGQFDINGNDVTSVWSIDHPTCQARCRAEAQCLLYQWANNNCYLKKATYNGGGVLGIKATRRTQPECGTKIRGINLGGWLVLERWMTPSGTGPFRGTDAGVAKDEWTLCAQLGKSACLTRLQQHWSTFITNADIDQIIERGLNAVRIPIGYWSLIPLKADEPFVAGAWQYLESIVKYAGSKNLIVWVDLHGLPGSQNGFDNSGRTMSPRGTWDTSQENLDRSVNAIAEIANRVAASADLTRYVTAIEMVNEPLGQNSTKLREFYSKAYAAVRSKLPKVGIVLHDQFQGADQWNLRDFWQRPNHPTEVIDGHIYFAFSNQGLSRNDLAAFTCSSTGKDVAKSSRVLPFVVGEWSLGFNCADCKAKNPQCDCEAPGGTEWDRKWAELQMDVFEQGLGWFYWSWKSENNDVWNYQWAANNGHVPPNAGSRVNTCASLGISFKSVYENL